jgi:GNAT superfamily N-acetyltransferase
MMMADAFKPKTKKIIMTPYNPDWPKIFEREASKIKEALGSNFNRIRMMKCAHYLEWEAVKQLRNKYFFDPLSISDPYTWTFDHPEHAHLVLYQGVDIIGYAHVQFWTGYRAALRILVIDEKYRQHGLGSQFLQLCEHWLKRLGVRSLHDEARPNAVSFYRRNGYTEMPFEDPSGEPPSVYDVAMGKRL